MARVFDAWVLLRTEDEGVETRLEAAEVLLAGDVEALFVVGVLLGAAVAFDVGALRVVVVARVFVVAAFLAVLLLFVTLLRVFVVAAGLLLEVVLVAFLLVAVLRLLFLAVFAERRVEVLVVERTLFFDVTALLLLALFRERLSESGR